MLLKKHLPVSKVFAYIVTNVGSASALEQYNQKHMLSFTHRHAVTDSYGFLSAVKHKRRKFEYWRHKRTTKRKKTQKNHKSSLSLRVSP